MHKIVEDTLSCYLPKQILHFILMNFSQKFCKKKMVMKKNKKELLQAKLETLEKQIDA